MPTSINTMALEMKQALQRFIIDASYDNQIDLAHTSLNMYIQAAKQTNIEPDKYLVPMDDALKEVFAQFKISKQASVALAQFTRQLQSSDDLPTRQAFHAINLLHCHYLSKDFLSQEEQHAQNKLFTTHQHIREKLLEMGEEIKTLKNSLNTGGLEALHRQLKKTILAYLELPYDQQIAQYPQLQKAITANCREELEELENMPERFTLMSVLRDIAIAIQKLAEHLHVVSPKSQEREHLVEPPKKADEERFTAQLIDVIDSLDQSLSQLTFRM